MLTNINVEEYIEQRKLENISVEINKNEQNIKSFSKTTSKTTKNIFTDIHNTIYKESIEDKDEKIIKLTYLLSLEEMKRINLKKDISKLKYENTLKELILKKNLKDKENANAKLKTYHFGYKVWKALLGDKVEKLTLIE